MGGCIILWLLVTKIVFFAVFCVLTDGKSNTSSVVLTEEFVVLRDMIADLAFLEEI